MEATMRAPTQIHWRSARILILLAMIGSAGCSSMSLDRRRVRDLPSTARGTDTRAWAANAHVAFAPLLPWPTRLGLNSDHLKTSDGSTAKICNTFRIDPATLGSPLANLCGIWHTARVSSE